MSTDYSYLGSGKIYVREYGAAAAMIEIGNCSALNLAPQTESKELSDHTTPGGGLRNEVERVKGVEMTYSFHDFSPENLARGLRGTATAAASGTATDELVVAYKGGFIPLAKIATAVSAVKNIAGSTTYVLDTDYSVVDGGIVIITAGAIPDSIAGAANLKVTYTYGAQNKLEALVNSAKQYQMIFVGLNEARSGKRTRVTMHKVSGGVLQSMALLGEDYGVGEVTGKLLSDTTITGAGLSKYFTADLED